MQNLQEQEFCYICYGHSRYFLSNFF